MSTSATTLTDLLKMLATSAVTVLTSYQAITAHIDSTVADEVRTASTNLHYSVERGKQHADSLHQVTMARIKQLEDGLQPNQRNRVKQVTF